MWSHIAKMAVISPDPPSLPLVKMVAVTWLAIAKMAVRSSDLSLVKMAPAHMLQGHVFFRAVMQQRSRVCKTYI